ncbi:hypothetical protein [Pectinatus haikarae]|uniref:Uncharacterized protein n=1 Tax=Pectinatus haikarae TaxID=349096 RepID=A0ABT9Y5W4_9FIRM|nr:hypothetical protein [Pectinatus haikarae]MDQ0203226.1 hypothetical protein [Pectinatus haikarae]
MGNLLMWDREEELLKKLPDKILNSIAHGATMALVKFWLFSEVKPDDVTLDAGIDAI